MKSRAIFVTGTDTGVGKSFFCATYLKALTDLGVNAGYFKPISTGCLSIGSDLVSEDMLFVEEVTGLQLDPHLNTPIRFGIPSSPLYASRLEGKGIHKGDIFLAFERLLDRHSLLIVEGIGGLMVPIEKDYLVLDLIKEMDLPVLVIARPSLGTINHTLLTLKALEGAFIEVLGFYTSGRGGDDDPTVRSNPLIIEEISGVRYLGHIPFLERYEMDKRWEELKGVYEPLNKKILGGEG